MEPDKVLTPEEIHLLAIAPFKSDYCFRKNVIKSIYLVGNKGRYDKAMDWRSEIKE